MAIRTKWTVEHACGHEIEHDLANRPADRRAGYARWLADRDCSVNCTSPASLGLT
ncbi:hypothetical protein [Streptomyces sp. UH6]|uniref:hypothetical protein n=1 Tax=Streptomyces sp. UH6 TaxID=2748379 RepID=UPI0015D4D95C|nr:hypothetical protein [Streptomyces sp. UH6]NYV73271.1 hypothetical protein [Streptomyces sp. UH6]